MLLCTLNLSRAKATGANVYGLICSVYNGLNLTNVRLPGSVGLTVRVRNVMTEGNTLAANTAFSHFYTSKIPAQMSGDLYKFLLIINQQVIL